MTTKMYVKRVLIILAITVILNTIACCSMSAISTVINNYLAVEQLENDDTAFLLMDTYTNLIKPIVETIVITCYAALMLYFVFITYKVIKTIKEN